MGKVIFSCGHEDKYRPIAGWPLTTKDYDTFEGDLEKSITYRHVCLDCYLKYIGTYPECVVFDEAEENEWFSSEDDL